MPFSSVLYSQMVPQGGLLSLLMESLKYMTPFLVFQSKPLGSCTPSGPSSCKVCKKWLEMVLKYPLKFSSNSSLSFSFASCRCGKSSKYLYQCYLRGTCSDCMQLTRSASLSLKTPLTSSQTDRAWLYACKAYMFKYKLSPTHRHVYNAEIMLMLCTHVIQWLKCVCRVKHKIPDAAYRCLVCTINSFVCCQNSLPAPSDSWSCRYATPVCTSDCAGHQVCHLWNACGHQ